MPKLRCALSPKDCLANRYTEPPHRFEVFGGAEYSRQLRSAASTNGRLALEPPVVTAVRSGEIRGAAWSELDLEGGLWTIPGSRVKAGKPHVVPLSTQVISIFKRAAEVESGGADQVFAGAKADKPMSGMTLVEIMRDMQVHATPHGFRSSFRDWAAEATTFPS